MRLLYLFFRSRLTGWALLLLTAVGGLAWLVLRQINYDNDVTLVLIVIPLLPAVVIGGSARSPFGDIERTASRCVSRLRFGHLAGLLVWGSLVLMLAGVTWNVASIEWELVRNLAGYTGIAFLGARVAGTGLSWVAPLGYATIALLADPDSRLTWPNRLPYDQWSLVVAMTLLAIGLVAITVHGERENPGECG